MTAQGSELIARAGSSMGWTECSEGDFSEVVCTVQQQQQQVQLALTVSSSEKKKIERREIAIIVTLPPSFFHSVFLSCLSLALSATCHHFSSPLPPENGGGNGCLAEEINYYYIEKECSEATKLRQGCLYRQLHVQSCTLSHKVAL